MTDPSRRPATDATAEEASRRLAAMSTVHFIAELHRRDVELWADDGRLRFSAPKGALTPELRDELVKRKSEVLRFLSQTTAAGDGALPLVPVPRTAPMPLSFAQERMWFFDRYEPHSSAYNMATVWRLRGAVQVAALGGALVEIVRRHEVLRTSFADADGRPVQVIAPRLVPALPRIDLARLTAPDRELTAPKLRQGIARQPFDLSRGPLLRLALVRLSAEEHLFVFAIHHIAADGWSSAVLATELLVLYEALLDRGAAAAAAALPALPIQYADFAHWQRQGLTGEVLERELGYWRRQLEGAPQVLELPSDRPRPSRPSYEAGKQARLMPSSLLRAVEALGQGEGCTPFMALLAAFHLLLWRTTGERDLLVGSPIANRNRAELEGLIGFFANTLVLRTRIQPEASFRELLAQVREVTLGAYEHQDVPFEKVIEALQPERALNYNPLVQVMFVLQNAPGPSLERSGLEMRIEPATGGQVVFDLIANLQETADGLRFSLRYPRALFDTTTMAALAHRYQVLIEHLIAAGDAALWQVEVLTAAERQQLVAEWNDTATPARPAELLHELFERQAERTPEAPAVVFEGEELSYRELDRRANQLARHLRGLGVAQEVRVGICAERSPELVVGLLGILKAGGAYVPLDPTYPAERLSFMAETAGVRVLLTQERLGALLPELAERICLDRDQPAISARPAGRPETATAPDQLAYVIFTSGSTGQPKGSMISHRAIVNRLLWMQEAYALREGEGVLQKTPFSFDVSVWEFFWPLAVGARLVVARPGGHQDGAYLAEVVAEQKVTTVHFVPSMLRVFLEEELEACDPRTGGPLKRVIASGEALPYALQERFFERLGAELHNLYGPTEAAVDVSWWACERASARASVPIGRPIANLRIHLLDRHLWPVPPPVVGEPHIGGVGLARGYAGRPELTAERFVPDPFSREPGGRLYKTGDLARYRGDASVEFLGRIDHQVQLRGFRIELGEIEAILGRSPGVRECAVLARESRPGDLHLAAYLVGDTGQEQLRTFLRAKLPEPMIPSRFEFLDALPLTPSGKVDRRALARRAIAEREPTAPFAAPADPDEELLASIWAEVLDRERVGVHDNFFELGGHSLLATQVVSRIREAFGVAVPVQRLFEVPTVAGLAGVVQRLRREERGIAAPPIRPVSRDQELPLSFAQQRLWFLDQLEPGSPTYNLPAAVRLGGALNPALLERVFHQVVRRHEALRTTFTATAGRSHQVIAAGLEVPLPLVALERLPASARVAEARRLAEAEALCPFDLSAGPLVRGTLLRLQEEDHAVLLNMHHIVSDGWSIGLFLREVARLYTAARDRQPAPLPPLPVQYADFAHWQRGWLVGEVLEAHLRYWRRQLAGAPARTELPADRPRPAVQTFAGRTLPVALDEPLSTALAGLGRSRRVTLFMTLVAAFKALLGRYSGQTDLVVGTPIAGRNYQEIEALIGFFVNTLVLRTDLAGRPSFDELLARVRRVALEAYAHQELPFEHLVEELRPQRDLSSTPLFQVMFILQNAPRAALEFSGLTLTPMPTEAASAKFDLTLTLEERASGIAGSFEYNTDLFDDVTIRRLAAHFATLLAAVVRDPARPVAEAALVSASEHHQLCREWNGGWTGGRSHAPLGWVIDERFSAWAAHAPDAVAVRSGREVLTYGELDRRVDRVARRLKALGVGPEVIVGLCVERSVALPVAVLGVLRSGGAYLPLDPAYPEDRLVTMYEDAGAALLVTDAQLHRHFSATLAGKAVRKLLIDDERPAPEATGALPYADPDHLAYAICTSGSTGRPKGVEISHRALINFLEAMRQYPGLEPQDVLLAVTSLSFDIAALEILLPLITGARLEVASRDLAVDGPRLAGRLQGGEITAVQATPASWRVLMEAGWQGDQALKVLCGGEALPRELARRLAARSGELWNLYGPTETTVWSTVERLDGGPVTIGRPIANTEIHVVDASLRPVPIAVVGELVIGGVGLARGYRSRAALTTEAFVPCPSALAQAAGERLYRTGDLARYLPDGRIEVFGRRDHQIKLRGIRVEPEEIETVLAEHPEVLEAAVIPREWGDRESAGGDVRLVAYVVTGAQVPESAELRAFLAARLPDPLVPRLFVAVESLPLTANRKVDRNALRRQSLSAEAKERKPAPPASELERRVAEIWREVLGVGQVGLDDNFFDLGGHSLLLVRVHSHLRELVDREFTLVELFRYPTIRTLADFLAEEIPDRDHAAPSVWVPVPDERRIAIVGLHGRFAGADNLEALWHNVCNRVESIRWLSDQELVEAGADPGNFNRPEYVKAARALPDPDQFDAAFFSYSPREAEIIDPQHRLFLECAWQALEIAGYDPGRFPGRIGVFGGSAMIRYAHNVYGNPEVNVDGVELMISVTPDYLCTRVAYRLNLRGPAVVLQSACSTSLLASHLARKSLLDGECDLALAGGVALTGFLKPLGYRYTAGGMVSADGHCRAFDAKAGGTVFADGVGIVVLKRLPDAIADGDHIHAVILGSASNNDGALKVGYTAPGFDGQADVIRDAHREAGTDPETITYVETHGTATILGDPIEVGALTRAFATDKRGFCALGTLKPNIGHTDAAASIAGLIKASMVLERGIIPPCLNFEEPNPEIDFAASPFFVNSELREWKSEGIPRRAGVSGFGVGGTNVHAVLEEPPPPAPSSGSRPWQLLRLSARTPTALENMTANLAAHLKTHPELSLADVAFTLKKGRAVFKQRKVWVCRDLGEAVAALRSEDDGWRQETEEGRRQVGFLFPGQGSQYAGMGQGLYETEAIFRDEIDRAAEILVPHLDLDLRQLLFPAADRREEAGRRLEETWLTQPALFVVEHALARLWMSWGIHPEGMLGHSIGEYVAACLAGVFSVEDALALVAARGRLMQEMPPGAMLSVRLEAEEVRGLLDEELSLAAVNSPGLCTVSGPEEAIGSLAETLAARGVDCRRLRTSHAFHSPMMEPARERFTERVAAVRLHPPEKPFLSNVTGTRITAAEATDPAYWGRHLRQPVLFAAGAEELLAEPNRVLLEVGPGRTLSTLVRQVGGQRKPVVLPSLRPPNRDDEDPWLLLGTLGRLWLAGVEPDWKGFYRGQKRRRVQLPTYPFERQSYWVEVVRASDLPGRAVRHADPADWLYAPLWEQAALPEPFDPAADDGAWLLLSDEGGLGEALAGQLRAAGRRVVTVRAGEGFARRDEDAYTVAPTSDADYETLLTPELRKALRHVVHLWTVTPGDGAPAQRREASAVLETGFYSLLALARALGRGAAGELHLAVVSNGLRRVLGDEALWPEKAAVLGPCKVIPQEYPDVRCSSIDVTLSDATPERVARQLLDELAADPSEAVIAYRLRRRWVEGFKPVRLEGAVDPRLPLRARGVYWITGGLGGLGLVFARHLAAAYQARLVLTGRSPVTATSAKIRALEELGAEVLVRQADVTDQAVMAAVVEAARERFGPIDGVFHAAGVPGGGVIQLKEREVAARVLAPKVGGVRVLEAVLGDQQPEFLVLFSSITGILPTFGQVDYCAANNVLDAFAEDYGERRPGTRALSVAWGAWEEVGMAAKAQLPGTPEAKPPEPAGESVGHPLLHRCLPVQGTETVFVSELHADRDWVLAEHRVVGIPTVPGTTYLEMAHAAFEHLTGSVEAELSEIVFLFPLMVDEGGRREVRTILETSGEGFAFRVASRDGETSWQEHVRGRIGPLPPTASAPCDLEAIRARCQPHEMQSAGPREGKDQATGEQEEVPVTLGPRWQSMGQLHLGEDEALVELTLPEEFAGDLEALRLHPALLDVATGMGRGLSQWGSTLPLSYARVGVRRPLGRRFFAHLRSRPETGVRRETFTVDLSLVDESGAVLVEVDQFTLKQAGRAVGRLTRGAADEPEAEAGPYGEGRQAIGEGIAPQEGVDLLRRMLSRYQGRRLAVSPRDLRGLLARQARRRRGEGESATRERKRPKHERPALQTSYAEPRNELETRIASIWADLLGIDQVGIRDDFFELGGHSLLATQLFSQLQEELGVNVPLPTIFEAQTVAELAVAVEKLLGPDREPAAGPPLVPTYRDRPLPWTAPLSFAQERLWFLQQLDPRSPAYNLPSPIHLRRDFDLPLLEQCMGEIVRRQAALRTVFVEEDGRPVQIVRPPPERFPLPVVDLTRLGTAAGAVARQLGGEETRRTFDLARDPMMVRARILVLPEEAMLLLTVHHIASDFWSAMLFLVELRALYTARSRNRAPQLPELAVQYVDFAVWQRETLSPAVLAEAIDWWRERLRATPQVLELVSDRPRPAVETHRGARWSTALPAALRSDLEEMARERGATLFMALLAAFQVLLHRYTGQSRFTVGTPVAGRIRAEVENLIGCFINNLVLRADLEDDPDFHTLLERVREETLEASGRQELPFEKLVAELQPQRDLSRAPLYQVMFVLHSTPIELGLSETPEIDAPFDPGIAIYDLTLGLNEPGADLTGYFEYKSDLFDATTVGRLAAHLTHLIRHAVEAPGTRISELSLAAAAERRQLLGEWNDTAAVYPSWVLPEATLPELFAAQVERRPEAVAILGERAVTYGELHARANRLAHHLRALEVRPEAVVGIAAGRGPEVVVGMLGVLKAGGVLLPLDPFLPPERLSFQLRDAGARVLLVGEATVPPTLPHLHQLPIAHASSPSPGRGEGLSGRGGQGGEGSGGDHLAYLIYTSGTTGTPKGVAVSHRQVLPILCWSLRYFPIDEHTRVLQTLSPWFDFGLFELLTTLLGGGKLYFVPADEQGDPDRYLEAVERHRLNTIHATPSFFRRLAQGRLSGVEIVHLGGEGISRGLVQQIDAAVGSGCRVYNGYGPTETSINSTILRLRERPLERELRGTVVPIGRPTARSSAWVLDRRGRSVPIGVPGELAIGGDGLARGYLNQPALSAERFVPDPLSGDAGKRLYRTGDLVRWLGDGNLDFLGRIDHQVKVRGFRIELGEIETVLLRHPGVQEAVVLAREDRDRPSAGDPIRLVAYFVAAGEQPAAGELRRLLSETLPEYMVPARFVALDSLPLTPSGKVDRAALAGEALPEPGAPQMRPLRLGTPAEAALARIWSRVLGIDQVGMGDDFFALGGDSILSIQVVSRARREGWLLTPRDLFQHPTLGALAAVAVPVAKEWSDQGPVTGEVPLTPIQHGFFAWQLPRPDHFNQGLLFEVRERLRPEWLERTLAALLEHHDALRLRFFRSEGRWRQVNDPPGAAAPFTRVDHSALPAERRGAALEAAAAAVEASLDLGRGPLTRLVLFEGGPEAGTRLQWVVHHLAVDGVSWRILLEDLEWVYRQLERGEPISLPPRTTSFRSWAVTLTERAGSPELTKELDFWRQQAEEDAGEMPVDHPGGLNTLASARTVTVRLPAEQTRTLLDDVHRAYRTRINDLLLAALAQAVGRFRATGTLLLDLEGHGREPLAEAVDLSRTVGWFTTLYPVLLECRDDAGEQIKAVKERLRAVPAGGIGYGLVRYLNPETAERLREQPAAPLVFNYLGQFDAALSSSSSLRPAAEGAGPMVGAVGWRRHLLEVNAVVARGCLQLHWTYSENLHRRSTIEALAAGFLEALGGLIRHCLSPAAGGLTPSDVPEAGMSQAEVDRLLADLGGVEAGQPESFYPLSPAQQGMLFFALVQREPSNLFINQMHCVLRGNLEPERFRAAWQRVVDRHAILRTLVVWEGRERPLQVVRPQVELPWVEEDWRHLPAAIRDDRMATLLEGDRYRGFDLSRAPLMRFTLVRTENQRFHFLWTMHQLILDGWSLQLLLAEVFACVRALAAGEEPQLPPPVPYREYIAWIERQDPQVAEEFWRRRLAGFEQATSLGVERRFRPGRAGERRSRQLAPSLRERLEELARRQQLTLNTVIQGAWGLLLHRYSGQRAVIFGAVVAGRPAEIANYESLVGLCINVLPVLMRVDPDAALAGWLSGIQADQAELRQFEHCPVEEIQRWLELPWNQPLFENLFIFENYPVTAGAQATGGAELSVEEAGMEEAPNYPLNLFVLPGEPFELRLVYDTGRFDEPTLERLLVHLVRLLEEISQDPQRRLEELSLMLPGEREQVLSVLATTPDVAVEAPCELGVHRLFEARAARTPSAPAVMWEGHELSYGELDRRANGLARRLAAAGVGVESVVGLCAERSFGMPVGMLGILKAGGIYLPLDPGSPDQRRAFMLEDAGAQVVVTDGAARDLPWDGRTVIALETAAEEGTPCDRWISAEQGAYVIYTSGSTGRPKGVVVSHRALASYAVRAADAYRIEPEDRVLQFAAMTFDASAEEIYPTLLRGAALVLREAELPSASGFLDACRDRGVTVVNLPTAYWHTLMADSEPAWPEGVRLVIIGGEEALPEPLRSWQERIDPRVRLVNTYGPTEATIVATRWTLESEAELGRVPIGRPVDGARAYVLDARSEPVAVGVPGELALGGDGVARGYPGRPALTAERFVPDPFGPPGGRLYLTGDRVRWRPDERLEFLGRLDQQVKIRGFRIEIGEIEAVIAEHPRVQTAAVVAGRPAGGEAEPAALTAYVVTRDDQAVDDLRAWLGERLPEYMVPASLVVLDAVPLTPAGKVDRAALGRLARIPESGRPGAAAGVYAPPESEVEEILTEIFAELLGRERVGIFDNFFELGGHSLLAVQLATRVRDAFEIDLPLREILEAPTVSDLAVVVEDLIIAELDEMSDEEVARTIRHR